MPAADKSQVDPTLYQMLVEQTRDYALFVLDPSGRVKTWNLGAQRLKGYEPEEVIGKHFSIFYTPDAVARNWPQYELKVALAEGRFEDEGWRVRKDGSRFWANVIITALREESGRLLGFSKITRDLSERKRQEEDLRQSEERFRLLLENVQDYAIFMLDPEGHVASWNTGAERIQGYARDEIIGKHFSRFFAAEDVEAGRPWEELADAKRQGRANYEGWRVRKDGSRFWGRVVISAVHDDDGKLRGFAKVTQDLSTLRQMQDLEMAAKNLNEFIATLAHELRNPLAPIVNATRVMKHLPPQAPEHAQMRETIERQAGQLTRIVDDMLDITRITRGQMQLEKAQVDLAEVVRRAAETLAPAIEASRHELEIDVPQRLFVHGDLHRLAQIVGNLLGNAARYTPAGGRISVHGASEGGAAVLRVRDNGRGIEAGMLGHIFEMFVQGRSALERVGGAGGGLGIGLALARRIAELHDGTLDAHSEGVGKGSEFTLRLPLAAAAAAADAAPPQEIGRPSLARRVLVVDDNVDAADTLHALLKSLGHETLVVHDGVEALKVMPQFQPDIVLLDIGLPGMDGYEVARRLAPFKNARKVKIVAVTGWGQDPDRQRSREAGIDVHLVKPVEPEVLAQVVEERNGATLH
ncbi:MAG TPA: PAS domain S-box protein [Burkholderiales bacterium]